RIRPSEQFVPRRLRRQRPHRQQRPLLPQHRREQQSADIRVATVDKAAVRECPELPQLSRLQVLPRLPLQRKLSKLCVEFVPRHESFLLCRSNAGTKRRPRDTVTVLLPHWLLRDFQSWGAPIIVDDPSARSPKRSNSTTRNKPATRKTSAAVFARRRECRTRWPGPRRDRALRLRSGSKSPCSRSLSRPRDSDQDQQQSP